jgi:hypothetical protein
MNLLISEAQELHLGGPLTVYTPHDVGEFSIPRETYSYLTAASSNTRLFD